MIAAPGTEARITFPPVLLDSLLDQALAHHRAGRLGEAVLLYEQVLATHANHADALHLLGVAAHQSGDSDRALEFVGRAIALNPDAASYHLNLGNILQSRGEARDAGASYLRALKIKPNLSEAHLNIGNLFLSAEQPEQAVEWYQKALAIKPDCPETHNNLGNAYRILLRLEEAIACYERAFTLKPDYAGAYDQAARLLRELGHLDSALLRFRQAQAIEPSHPRAGFGEAMVQFLQGDFRGGFRNYERRWTSSDHATPWRDYSWPVWQGGPVESGKILLWPEQGVGDEIMFAGMLPDIAQSDLGRGNQYVLACDARLQSLFARSFPNIEVMADPALSVPPEWKVGAHLPIGSLPGLRYEYDKPGMSFTGAQAPYLIDDPARQRQLRERYTDGSLVVGIAWYSNNEKTGKSRSIDLPILMPLLQVPGVRWVSLQYGVYGLLQDQISVAGAPIHVDPEVDQLADLDEFAAQVAAMDLVITIDNTTAHLAGALGIPVWNLLHFAPDWRWQATGDQSMWYPTMRLFRQSVRGDWRSLVALVRNALIEYVA